MPNNNDIAYTAGIIDDEGCIRLKKHWRKLEDGRRRYSLGVGVTVGNNSEWLVNWLKFHYGGSVYIADRQRVNLYWHWQIETRQALEFLELILPYLKIKRPQAEIAIQFGRRRNKRGKKLAQNAKIQDEADQILITSYKHLT